MNSTENKISDHDDPHEERSEAEMGHGYDMDFNYSREALEMFKGSRKKLTEIGTKMIVRVGVFGM